MVGLVERWRRCWDSRNATEVAPVMSVHVQTRNCQLSVSIYKSSRQVQPEQQPLHMPPHFPVPFRSLASPLHHRLVPRARHQHRLGCVPRRSKRLLRSRQRQLCVERI